MTPRPPDLTSLPDEAFDDVFRELGGVEPPAALCARTLSAVAMSREAGASPSIAAAPTTRRRLPNVWVGGLAGLAAAAAGAWMLVPSPSPTGDPSTMVPRGIAEPAALTIDLKLAVRRADGSVERYSDGVRYRAGDTLLFRVSLPRAVRVSLLRDDAVLWTGERPGGEGELPVGYALEAGEPAADFVVVAAPVAPSTSPGASVRIHVAGVAP